MCLANESGVELKVSGKFLTLLLVVPTREVICLLMYTHPRNDEVERLLTPIEIHLEWHPLEGMIRSLQTDTLVFVCRVCGDCFNRF